MDKEEIMEGMMDINKMTRKDFDALPHRGWNQEMDPFDGLVILPQRSKHDSGYRCMDFVAVKKAEAICRLSGCSDVIHIDGIGGYGKDWLKKTTGVPRMKEIADISIDCLPRSGLLHIFSRTHYITVGAALSSFEVFFDIRRR